ncbi:AbiEi antitoxin N-terminal domain-containing protein [Halovulum sp. GXIMD14793]
MSTPKGSKLNHLQTSLPQGMIVDSGWMETHGFSPSLRNRYVKSGWLEQPARGVYRRPGGQMSTGEEFLFVVEGKMIVQAEGKADVVLRAGESLYFDSGRGHLYASATDHPARILCVCTGIGDSDRSDGAD